MANFFRSLFGGEPEKIRRIRERVGRSTMLTEDQKKQVLECLNEKPPHPNTAEALISRFELRNAYRMAGPESTRTKLPAQPTQPPQNAPQNAKEPQITRTPEPPQPTKPQLGKRANPNRDPNHNNLPYPDPSKEIPLGSVYLGNFPDTPDRGVWIFPFLRTRHTYAIGKTRTGKTTLIKNLALQDIEQGAGVCFVDPHGDAAEDLIGSIPQPRIKDVIYFDPSTDYAPAFNIFRLPYRPDKLTEDTISVLKMFYGSSWGFRMEHILRYAILTLLHDSTPRTLRDLRQLLVNERFRAEIIANIQDEGIREFWETEFSGFPANSVDPIVNKLSSFLVLGSPLLKIFSQPENDLDFSRILNEQKILIVNLAKGKLGEEPSRLLGGLIVTGIQQAALARADMPPEQRKDFYLYLDEFQNFVVQSFESILSEAAKYKLFLTLAHQTLNQVPSYLTSSIFGNVATLIAFQISADDAHAMQREMHRTRYMYRQPNKPNFYEFEDLLNAEREKYRQQAASWQEELDKMGTVEEYIRSHKNQTPEQARKNWEGVSAMQRSKRDKELKRLDFLNSSDFTLSYIRERWPDYEFKETTFPDTDDFINQQPRHMFCRLERAENVYLLRTLPAPDPNPQVKAAVIREMEQRHQEREKKLAAEKKEQLQPVQVAAPQAPELTEPQQPRKPKFIFTAPMPPPPAQEEPTAAAAIAATTTEPRPADGIPTRIKKPATPRKPKKSKNDEKITF